MLARPDGSIDLAEASLLIACEEYPDLDVAQYLSHLEALGGELNARVSGTSDRAAIVAALNAILFEEQGFTGNTADYYDPRNSFLNDVLDRKTGIPITLSMVYIEVARRAGVAVHGVGLPGHFIVKLAGPGDDVLVDPFHGGALLSVEDCQQRLDRIYEGRVKVEASMLEPCGRKEILSRTLRNLRAIYARGEDLPRAIRTVDLLLVLDPGSPHHLRDRGMLYAALDCYALAARDLEEALRRAPASPEAATLSEKIDELRRKAARLH
jgi:regulator of sirC expression with transglutaminase-like and TPR domain